MNILNPLQMMKIIEQKSYIANTDEGRLCYYVVLALNVQVQVQSNCSDSVLFKSQGKTNVCCPSNNTPAYHRQLAYTKLCMPS